MPNVTFYTLGPALLQVCIGITPNGLGSLSNLSTLLDLDISHTEIQVLPLSLPATSLDAITLLHEHFSILKIRSAHPCRSHHQRYEKGLHFVGSKGQGSRLHI